MYKLVLIGIKKFLQLSMVFVLIFTSASICVHAETFAMYTRDENDDSKLKINKTLNGYTEISKEMINKLFFHVDSNNVPYIAYESIENGNKIRISKFDRDKWIPVSFTTSSNFDVRICGAKSDRMGNYYLLLHDIEKSTIIVKKYDGANWSDVGIESHIGGHDKFSFAIDASGTPFFVCAKAVNTNNTITIKKVIGSQFVEVANALSVNGVVNALDFALDSHGILYITYSLSEKINGNNVFFKKLINSNWLGDENIEFSTKDTRYISMRIDKKDNVYVLFEGSNNKNGVFSFVKYNGYEWEIYELNDNFLFTIASQPSFAIDFDNIPYIAWSNKCAFLPPLLTIQKMNEKKWIPIINQCTSSDLVLIDIDQSNNIYMVCNNLDNGGVTSVMEWRLEELQSELHIIQNQEINSQILLGIFDGAIKRDLVANKDLSDPNIRIKLLKYFDPTDYPEKCNYGKNWTFDSTGEHLIQHLDHDYLGLIKHNYSSEKQYEKKEKGKWTLKAPVLKLMSK